MKGRSQSQRLPNPNPMSAAPPNDWVEESWTVDCVCGVNFDDGEEMVKCDECGVWVHTRCSRYVKGDSSFNCDKCKAAMSTNHRSEETEVAQLLVELPTKTMRIETSAAAAAAAAAHLNDPPPPPHRPFRLWTHRPIEERVHVQGVSGGDPALFPAGEKGGLKSVFTRQLWNCSGYVPKKFNFQYREFPCWEGEEEEEKKDDTMTTGAEMDGDNPINRGAGVLFALSKETKEDHQAKRGGGGGSHHKPILKEMKKRKGEDLDYVRDVSSGAPKGRSLLRPIVIHSSKQSREDSGISKVRSAKKKAKTVDREFDADKIGARTTKTVFAPTNDAKQMEFYDDRGPRLLKSDKQSIKSRHSNDFRAREPVESNVEKEQNNLLPMQYTPEVFSSDASKLKFSTGAGVLASDRAWAQTDDPLKADDVVKLPMEENGHSYTPGLGTKAAKLDEFRKSEPPLEELATAAPEIKHDQDVQRLTGDMSLTSVQAHPKVKSDEDFDKPEKASCVHSFPSNDVKMEANQMAQHSAVSGQMSENLKTINAIVNTSHSSDHKQKDVDRSAATSDCHLGKSDDLSADPCQVKQEPESSGSPLAVQKFCLEPRHGSKVTEEPFKGPSVPLSQHNVVSTVGNCSAPATITISGSYISDKSKLANSVNLCSVSTKQEVSRSNINLRKDHILSDPMRDEKRHAIPKKTVMESAKSSVSKASHSSRISHPSVSRRNLPDTKDPVTFASSKAYASPSVANATSSTESVDLVRSPNTIPVESRQSTSGLQPRGEKYSQSSCLPSCKVNHILSTYPPASSKAHATLSDEELALLLHQELNSSPRVPRVPRMRQAGSLPQLASQTATSMLIKRSSSSGGKDSSSVSRRKSKDAFKDGAHRSSEIADEAKKMDRVPTSLDQQRPDYTTDVSTDKNVLDDSATLVHSVSKIPLASSKDANSGLSSSTEANDPNSASVRNSPRNISDDDTGTTGGSVHQTLPGLLSVIMSKGKRMTYEELCNAVLPHWHNLRKHNGERYAYSSPSQAVLDCLRNRSEWAQLVDRGPKTNVNKKRRKLDAEISNIALENNDGDKNNTRKLAGERNCESNREEFPKGKRKARKRRRLAIKGRRVKDVRRIRKVDMLTDDDSDSFSNSSEDSMFSGEEIQNDGTHLAGSEASASSDETGTIA